jgi:hypothetical protein
MGENTFSDAPSPMDSLSTRSWTERIDLRSVMLVVMSVGTAILLALFLYVMLRQPFEPTDDLIWLSKLRSQSFLDLPLSSAWMVPSVFYRPVAEAFLKALYSMFGLNLTPYRWTQFAIFVVMIGLGGVVLRQLRLNWEGTLVLVVFAMGSPFMYGSIVWIAELPHVIVLVSFTAALAAILSNQSTAAKLSECGLAFAIALLSKENGLALIVFYCYFLRTAPIKAAIVFGAITAAYFIMRAIVIGPSMGASGVEESVGFGFRFLTTEQRLEMFEGYRIYGLYAYDIITQNVALFLRLTQWGKIVDKLYYQTYLQIASTVLIAIGLIARLRRRREISIIDFLIIATTFGGTLFSYSYARDRHLALPAWAYGFLLIIAAYEIGRFLKSRSAATTIFFCVWLAWSVQAYCTIKYVRSASFDVIERTYRSSPNPGRPPDVWAEARRQALELAAPPK